MPKGLPMKRLALAALLLIQPGWSAKNYYVNCSSGSDANDGLSTGAPVRTITKARDLIRTFKTATPAFADDIVVNIAAGTCGISSTIFFDQRDGGINGRYVLYKAQDANNKPVISGGTTYSAWTKGNPKWTANIGTGKSFKALYVNGRKAVRARTEGVIPVSGYQWTPSPGTPTGVRVFNGALGAVSGATNFDVVWNFEWRNARLPALSITTEAGSNHLINMKTGPLAKAWQAPPDNMLSRARDIYLTGHVAFLDRAGEWAYNSSTGVLAYQPLATDTTAGSTVRAIVSTLDTLVKVSSTSSLVRRLRFQNLRFAHADWRGAVSNGTYNFQAENQIDLVNSDPSLLLPAAIHIQNDSGIHVLDCVFENINHSALRFGTATNDALVQGNYFHDIGGSAVSVGRLGTVASIPNNVRILNNLIYDVGNEHHGCPGISVYYATRIQASNNEISNLPYTGISIGWGWNNSIGYTAAHTLLRNRIFNFNNLLWDGAGIYTVGELGNAANRSLIERNYIYGDKNISKRFGVQLDGAVVCVGGAIYHDDGSTFITDRNNIVHGPEQDSLNWLYIHRNAQEALNMVPPHPEWIVRDISIEGTQTALPTSIMRAVAVSVTGTVVTRESYWSATTWNDINASGLQSAYYKRRDQLPVDYRLKADRVPYLLVHAQGH